MNNREERVVDSRRQYVVLAREGLCVRFPGGQSSHALGALVLLEPEFAEQLVATRIVGHP